MATSSSVNFNLTANQVVTAALRKLGVISNAQSAEGEDYNNALQNLNTMVKTWQTQGINLWKQAEFVIFLTAGQQSYKIGGTSPDRIASEDVVTEVATAASSGASTLTVDSTTGMAASDNIGIELDDGTLQWTTIVSVDSTTTLTLTATLTDDVAVDNNVYVYTTAFTERLIEIDQIRLSRDNDTEVVMQRISRDAYFGIPDKTSAAVPTQYYIDRQRDHTNVYVWGTANDVKDRLMVTGRKLIEDFDSSTDDADFPQEWFEALVYNLAVRIAPEHHKEEKVVQGTLIATMAVQTLQALKSWDQEHTSLKIIPNTDRW